MKKIRKKFIIYAETVVFILLTVLLSVINILNFSMAAEDADRVTERLSRSHGMIFRNDSRSDYRPEKSRMGPMGPDSPEMDYSIRYFTFCFDKDGKAYKIEFKMSAVSEEEAQKWAESLIDQTTGWTNGTYRYRVYEDNGQIFVTVIDQGRELLPSYRILIISIIGEIFFLIVSLIVLNISGKRLFKPIEEADRKQKRFIAGVEREFKMPLTIINANTEIIEKQSAATEQTKAINRQVRKMTVLVKNLAALSIFEEKDINMSRINLSDLFSAEIDRKKEKFDKKGIEIVLQIEPEVIINGDGEAFKRAISEIVENALKFSESKAEFRLERKKDRIILQQSDDTKLKNGSIDQIFDRFTRLENAGDKEGNGLGLSYFKDIIKAHNGRVSAKVSDGIFIIRADL